MGMNPIRESLEKIQATEELKQNTLQYLNERRQKKNRVRAHYVPQAALAAAVLFCMIGIGGYSVYRKPVSYISIDVNPSIELGLNCFGRVVSTEAYNDDGGGMIEQVPLKNVSYMQAINRLINDDKYNRYLNEDAVLVFTVISDQPEKILEELHASELTEKYEALTYTSDPVCREEAHRHEMSFGKYRTYLELLEYDEDVTIEDCHGMTMGELRDRIDECAHDGKTGSGKEHHGNEHERAHDCVN